LPNVDVEEPHEFDVTGALPVPPLPPSDDDDVPGPPLVLPVDPVPEPDPGRDPPLVPEVPFLFWNISSIWLRRGESKSRASGKNIAVMADFEWKCERGCKAGGIPGMSYLLSPS
jgi:hypothetical protein